MAKKKEQAAEEGGALRKGACCGIGLMQEPVYYTTADNRRQQLGHVNFCMGCRKAVGSLKVYRGKAPAGFGATSWRLMMDTHPSPPWYFVTRADGLVVPEGYGEGPGAAQDAPGGGQDAETGPEASDGA